jgi:hypothetical protein
MGDNRYPELIEAVIKSPAMIILSGYDHSIFKELKGWNVVSKEVSISSRNVDLGEVKGTKTEMMWINPKCMESLSKTALMYGLPDWSEQK